MHPSILAADTLKRPSRSHKVLVIEDDDGAQEFIQHLLTAAQRDAIVCRPGREGLESARRNLPAVILLDLGLPDLNGVEVFKLLRADPATRGIPVLLILETAVRRCGTRDCSDLLGLIAI